MSQAGKVFFRVARVRRRRRHRRSRGKGLGLAKDARGFCSHSDAKHATQRLEEVKRTPIQYAHRLSGLSARRKIDATLRAEVLAPVKPFEADVGTLRSRMSCPVEGAS